MALRQATGLAVPEPVPNLEGDLVTLASTQDGGETRHCDLLTWLDGKPRYPGQGLGLRSVNRLGEFLGCLHAYSQRFAPPEGFALPRWDAGGLFTERSPYKPGPLGDMFSDEQRALFAEVERRSRAVLRELGEGDGEFGIIHADFILGNCLFQGREPRLLDFDDCGWGYFLYDMCPMLGNLKDYPRYPALRREFLAGYRSIRPLLKEHEAHIDLFIAARHAMSCLWVAGNQRSSSAGPDLNEHVAYRIGEVRNYLSSTYAHPFHREVA